METSFTLTVKDSKGVYAAELVEMPKGSTAPHSLSFGGRHYAILSGEGDLSKVLDILQTLYPGALSSSSTLSTPSLGSTRVTLLPKEEVGINSIVRRISKTTATRSVVSTPSKEVPNTWMAIDKTYLRHVAEQIFKKTTDPTILKDFLHYHTYEDTSILDFERCFDIAFATKNIELFLPLLDHVCEDDLAQIISGEKLDLPIHKNEHPNNFTFTENTLRALDLYVHDPVVGFSGVITLQDAKGTYTIASEGINPATPFAMHSIGKVFTGMLAICLIREGKITEEMLNKPIQLAPSVLARLPPKVQKHLSEKKPTLLQVMLHHGGLGEFQHKLTAALTQAVLSGTPPPQMKTPEDFLPFAEEDLFPLEEEHYSNLGLLLVGLSLQHRTGISFDDLLQSYIIKPAHISCFSSQKPKGARVNLLDPIAEHICGSPAGGYWTTAQDLCRFGEWITLECKKDPNFLELIKKYGGEFYSEEELHHSGGITSASAYLSIFPQHGVIISILSDRKSPSALKMNDAIRNHILKAN